MADIALVTANTMRVVGIPIEQYTISTEEAITAGQAVRINPSTGLLTKANATDATEGNVLGIATRTPDAVGLGLTVIRKGILDGYDLTDLDYGEAVYLSDTDGRVAEGTPGTLNVVVGRVVSAQAQGLGTAPDKVLAVDIQPAEDLSLDSATIAGALEVTGTTTLNGNVALGNSAAADTVTVTADTTVATGGTVVVTDADAVTIGGNIALVHENVCVSIPLHATKTEYNLFVAEAAYQVVDINYTPDIAEGGALTATVVKAAGTATPASGTTPMHAANAINLNGTAHTVQAITLTATTADLQLAAGNRIGLDLSGAMTVGSGLVHIRLKRI